ncbi:unnamed protein product [Sphagnum balticum]
MGNKRAHMPGQMGGLSPIRTAHHFKRTYVSTSIEYSVEPVNHASARWCVGQRARSTRLLKRAQPQIFSNYFAAISFLARGKMLRSAEGKGPKLADAVRLSGRGKRHRSLK